MNDLIHNLVFYFKYVGIIVLKTMMNVVGLLHQRSHEKKEKIMKNAAMVMSWLIFIIALDATVTNLIVANIISLEMGGLFAGLSMLWALGFYNKKIRPKWGGIFLLWVTTMLMTNFTYIIIEQSKKKWRGARPQQSIVLAVHRKFNHHGGYHFF